MSDETRLALRRACVEHNVTVITSATSIEKIDLHRIIDVYDVLARYDRGESIMNAKGIRHA
jgi:hypothetical protein